VFLLNASDVVALAKLNAILREGCFVRGAVSSLFSHASDVFVQRGTVIIVCSVGSGGEGGGVGTAMPHAHLYRAFCGWIEKPWSCHWLVVVVLLGCVCYLSLCKLPQER